MASGTCTLTVSVSVLVVVVVVEAKFDSKTCRCCNRDRGIRLRCCRGDCVGDCCTSGDSILGNSRRDCFLGCACLRTRRSAEYECSTGDSDRVSCRAAE